MGSAWERASESTRLLVCCFTGQMCVAVCGGVGGEGEAGAKTASLLSWGRKAEVRGYTERGTSVGSGASECGRVGVVCEY